MSRLREEHPAPMSRLREEHAGTDNPDTTQQN